MHVVWKFSVQPTRYSQNSMFGYLARLQEVGRLESFSAPFVYFSFLYFNGFARKSHTNLYVPELKTDYVVILFVNTGSRTYKVFTFNLKIQPYLCNFYAGKNYFHLEILHEYQLNRMLNHAYEEWSSFFFSVHLGNRTYQEKNVQWHSIRSDIQLMGWAIWHEKTTYAFVLSGKIFVHEFIYKDLTCKTVLNPKRILWKKIVYVRKKYVRISRQDWKYIRDKDMSHIVIIYAWV